MRPIVRIRTDGVSPVVAEILLVAITVVLAAVVYLMASGILTGHTESVPVVAFAPGVTFTGGSHNVTLMIGGTSQNLYPFNYEFNLKVDAAYGVPTQFAASRTAANVTIGGTLYRVTWTDADGAGAGEGAAARLGRRQGKYPFAFHPGELLGEHRLRSGRYAPAAQDA